MIYLDCSSGMAGDMFAAALAGLGADRAKIERRLRPIARVKFSDVRLGGVSAVRFVADFKPESHDYPALVGSIRSLRLGAGAQRLSLRILRILAQAESEAHEVPLRRVHLHEAVDCVVDAAAAALALEELGELDGAVGSTVVSCGANAPATMRIIREYGIPVRFVSERELLTPTGAAILAALAPVWGEMDYSECGLGAGTMKLPWPNVLKAAKVSPKVVLESNIDDCTPEQIAHMSTALMSAGALDVHTIPCMMKKGRIGFLVRVLTERASEHAGLLMAETGSIGVRVLPVERRYELPRRVESVKVRLGGRTERVRVKFTPLGYKPEFDDVSEMAKRYKLTFRQVLEKVDDAVSQSGASGRGS